MDRTGTMLILLATVLLMVVAACTQRETYDRTLMRAERMTDTNPYGALTLLNGRKDSLCAGPADSALYELVYTEAVHDLGVTLANSAYIDRSADYFRQCGDRRRRARALVQTALCRYDNRDCGAPCCWPKRRRRWLPVRMTTSSNSDWRRLWP